MTVSTDIGLQIGNRESKKVPLKERSSSLSCVVFLLLRLLRRLSSPTGGTSSCVFMAALSIPPSSSTGSPHSWPLSEPDNPNKNPRGQDSPFLPVPLPDDVPQEQPASLSPPGPVWDERDGDGVEGGQLQQAPVQNQGADGGNPIVQEQQKPPPPSSLAASPPAPPSLLHLSFNQDHGCFAVGTDQGFRIYNCDPFREIFRRDFDGGGIGVVEMLFRCNILALVGGGPRPNYPPNKVMIWDDHQSRCIGELSFRSEVRAVRLRRDRIIVVLDHKIFVYNFADLKLVHQIETVPNPKGLCAVSQQQGSLVLVCPGGQKGQVRVEHYGAKRTKFIMAHDSRIACFALSQDGRFIATASSKGTLVRIFSTVDGSLLQEVCFEFGSLSRDNTISCLFSLFSFSSCLLCFRELRHISFMLSGDTSPFLVLFLSGT